MNIWNYHDTKMQELKQLYNKTSKQTQNRLQEIFDTFNFTQENIYDIATNKVKKRINTYIDQWKEQGLLKNNNYFTVLANNIYKKTRVKNSEILELLIYSVYIEEQSKLEEQEKQIMYEDANYYYEQGQQEVNKKKKPSILAMALFLALLDQPNYSGFNWKQYIEATIQYNAQQIYKQAILNIQQQKNLEIDSSEFQTIINRQNNQKLNINNSKISGATDLQMIGLNNLAKIEGIKEVTEDNSKVRFIAVEDDKTTQMCDSLNNQEFYINKENVFDRYYGENQKELRLQRIRCNGLVVGLNLPPIQHHFHYCRSTIMYLPYVAKEKDNSEDEDILKYLDVNNYIKKDITKQKNILIKQAFKNDMIRNIALNNDIEKICIYGKKSKHKANKIYLNAEWKNSKQDKKDRTIRHEVGHAIDYKYGHVSCGGELTTALEIDKLRILKYKDTINKKLKSKEYEEYAELSDIIGGLTDNKVKGKYKHDNEYWKRKNALEKETFADLFAIAGGNDVKYLQVINEYLPNTLKVFDDIIRRIK